ncbi:MAG: hypothetical protein ACI8ZT_000647 [Bacteroidia bacterium]
MLIATTVFSLTVQCVMAFAGHEMAVLKQDSKPVIESLQFCPAKA